MQNEIQILPSFQIIVQNFDIGKWDQKIASTTIPAGFALFCANILDQIILLSLLICFRLIKYPAPLGRKLTPMQLSQSHKFISCQNQDKMQSLLCKLDHNLEMKFVLHCAILVVEGKNLIRKLASDQMQIIPRTCRTFKSVPKELFMAMLWAVISAPLTVNDKAVTSCAALFSWCNL